MISPSYNLLALHVKGTFQFFVVTALTASTYKTTYDILWTRVSLVIYGAHGTKWGWC